MGGRSQWGALELMEGGSRGIERANGSPGIRLVRVAAQPVSRSFARPPRSHPDPGVTVDDGGPESAHADPLGGVGVNTRSAQDTRGRATPTKDVDERIQPPRAVLQRRAKGLAAHGELD